MKELIRHPLETITQFTMRRIRAEIIEECAQIAGNGAKDCCEGDSEWHRGFRYAATNTALQIADRIRALKSTHPTGFEKD